MTLGKPPRLERVFQIYDPPIYFVTMCTSQRRQILTNEIVHRAILNYGQRGQERGIALGRFVIMPDHIHLFVCGRDDFNLGLWVRGLKRVVAAPKAFGAAPTAATTAAASATSIWQRGFFDHVIRNSESYSAKWEYVRENPVRAGLVRSADEWPF